MKLLVKVYYPKVCLLKVEKEKENNLNLCTLKFNTLMIIDLFKQFKYVSIKTNYIINLL